MTLTIPSSIAATATIEPSPALFSNGIIQDILEFFEWTGRGEVAGQHRCLEAKRTNQRTICPAPTKSHVVTGPNHPVTLVRTIRIFITLCC